MSEAKAAPADPRSPPPPRNPVQKKLIWLVTGFIILSGAITGLALLVLRSQAIESSERLTQSFAQVIEEQTERSIQAVDQNLQLAQTGLAELAASGQLTEASGSALLRQRLKETAFSGGLFVLDATGRIVFSSSENVGLDLKDRPYFRVYLDQPETELYVGVPTRGRTTGIWGLPVARPLRAADGAFSGVIAAGLQPQYFDRLWSQVDLGLGSAISLFRRDGTLMMRSPFDESVLGNKYSERPLFRQLVPKGEAGSFRDVSPFDGQVRLLSYRALSAHPELVVVVGQSYAVVLAPWSRLAGVALAVWAFASIAIATLGQLLDRAWQQGAQREVQAQQMAERFSLATSTASIGVWDWEPKSQIFFASPAYFSMLGDDPEGGFLAREKWLARIHPEDRDMVAETIRESLAGTDIPYLYEARALHADGSYRWIRAFAKVFSQDADGQATRLLGVRTDITERRQAEETLRVSDQALKAISEGVVIISPEPRILSANEAFTRLTGYDQAELMGRASPFLPGPLSDPEVVARIRQAIQEGGHFYGEILSYRKDGTTFWNELSISPVLDPRGRPTHAIAIVRDVSERKMAETALVKSLHEKGALLKEVHHRVKNNLQVITSLLRLETGRATHPATRFVLKDMQARIQAMALLHETLYRTGTFAGVDLGAYLKQLATQSFRALNVQPHHVQLDLDLASVRVGLEQAIPCGLLVNELISNGLKHGFPSGHTGGMTVELLPVEEGRLLVRVRDTGVGLPADFEARRGQSLGLQLVSDLARQVGGRLEIGPGPGGSFSVVFTPEASKQPDEGVTTVTGASA